MNASLVKKEEPQKENKKIKAKEEKDDSISEEVLSYSSSSDNQEDNENQLNSYYSRSESHYDQNISQNDKESGETMSKGTEIELSSDSINEDNVVIDLEAVNTQPFAFNSLFFFPLNHPFRKSVIKIIKNRWSERFILVIIIINCVFLALDDPQKEQLRYQQIADFIFQLIFTTEAILKIVAMGFAVEQYTYLRNAWNIVINFVNQLIVQLDFFVVIVGWVGLVLTAVNISGIRVIRVLRPLRTISSIQSMRKLIQSLVTSLPAMLDFLILFIFFLIIFGTLGTQLFGDLFNYRCVDNLTQLIALNTDGNEIYCNRIISCSYNQTCTYLGNPNSGATSFDNVMVSSLNIFIILTMVEWTSIMYEVRRATDNKNYDFFFLVVVIFGSYLLINLMVAVQYSYLHKSFGEKIQILGKTERQVLMSKKKSSRKSGINIIEEIQNEILEENNNIASIQKNKKSGKCQQYFQNVRKRINRKRENPSKCEEYTNKCYSYISIKCNWVLDKKWFSGIIAVIIVLNTLLMAMEYYGMSTLMYQVIEGINSAFTIVFALEMIIKILGYGAKQYAKDFFNVFDTIVVILGLLEFASIGNKAFTVLRIFRLLRMLKIIRQWKSLQKIIVTVLKCLMSLANLALLIFLLMFVYALIGMQFLSGEVSLVDGQIFRYDFNSFQQSMINTFVILTAESWTTMLYFFIQRDGWAVTAYFTTLITFGNIILLNLFLALLLNFIQDTTEKDELIKKQSQNEEVYRNGLLRRIKTVQLGSQQLSNSFINKLEPGPNEEMNVIAKSKTQVEERKSQISYARYSQRPSFISDKSNQSRVSSIKKKSISQQQGMLIMRQYTLHGKSLLILGPENKIRIKLKELLEHPYFEQLLLYLILLNSIIMALNQPYVTDPFQNKTFELITNIIIGIYIAESALKIIVMGFVIGKGTYLRDSWNIFDFIIVLFSILTWILQSVINLDIPFLRIFKAFRALRPLKMISKSGNLKLVVTSLLQSIPSLVNVAMIHCIFLYGFGIVGVQIFSGALGSCNDLSIINKPDCTGSYNTTLGIEQERQWTVPFSNFDNIFSSMLAFFEISTYQNWSKIMFTCIDSQDVDMGPSINQRPYVFLLFMAFIFITSFFTMNLYISVIVDKFNIELIKNQSQGLTEDQTEWVKLQLIMAKSSIILKIPIPKGMIRKTLYKIVQNKWFEYLIMLIVAGNTIIICMDYVGQSPNYFKALDISNQIFTILFAIEAIMKLTAFGFKSYFLDIQNTFDFAITIFSIIALNDSLFSIKFNAMRIIRAARILRMVKTLKRLRKMLKILWLSLKNIASISLILFLVFFSFTIAGQQIFGNMKYNSEINSDANFDSFQISLFTLFRAATGDNWSGMMHESFGQVGWISIVYFVFFQIVTKYIFLNIFIAVILQNFNEVEDEDKRQRLAISRKDIRNFFESWSKFNPHGDTYLRVNYFCAFLQDLPQPLGFQGLDLDSKSFLKLVSILNIKTYVKDQGKPLVYLPEVLFALFRFRVGIIGNVNDLKNSQQIRHLISILKQRYKGLDREINYKTLVGLRDYYEVTVQKYLTGLKFYNAWMNVKKLQRKPTMILKKQTKRIDCYNGCLCNTQKKRIVRLKKQLVQNVQNSPSLKKQSSKQQAQSTPTQENLLKKQNTRKNSTQTNSIVNNQRNSNESI